MLSHSAPLWVGIDDLLLLFAFVPLIFVVIVIAKSWWRLCILSILSFGDFKSTVINVSLRKNGHFFYCDTFFCGGGGREGTCKAFANLERRAIVHG